MICNVLVLFVSL